ncbi:MAG: polymer-forming cytoskeletal protein [Balneolaceae bacterium]|nr:MAG: polymer-forming cytoskeletal protein [Balneolaceae bacterium]
MFKKQPLKVNNTAQKPPSLNMISEGTHIKGTINSKSDLRIAGRIDGDCICKGKIIVTSTANLSGNLISTDADISGYVDGTVKVAGKLTLRQGSVVGGDLHTKTLIVEEGAQFNGSCKMGEGNAELNGMLDAEFAKSTKIKKPAKQEA